MDTVYALAVFGIMSIIIDRFVIFLEKNSEVISWLPDKFEPKTIYILVFILGYGVCWMNQFSLLIHFGEVVKYNHIWFGYIMTAGLLSGGSKLFREAVGMVNLAYQALQGGYGGISSMFSSSSDSSNPDEIKYTGNDENPV